MPTEIVMEAVMLVNDRGLYGIKLRSRTADGIQLIQDLSRGNIKGLPYGTPVQMVAWADNNKGDTREYWLGFTTDQPSEEGESAAAQQAPGVPAKVSPAALRISRKLAKDALAERHSILARTERDLLGLLELVEPHKRALAALAPASVSTFLAESDAINGLFEYEAVSRYIVYGKNPYGFNDAGEVREAFAALQEAWRDLVVITLSEGEPHRTEVVLKVV